MYAVNQGFVTSDAKGVHDGRQYQTMQNNIKIIFLLWLLKMLIVLFLWSWRSFQSNSTQNYTAQWSWFFQLSFLIVLISLYKHCGSSGSISGIP